MATNPTPETPALAGGKDNAPLLAALKALEAQLTTTKEPEKMKRGLEASRRARTKALVSLWTKVVTWPLSLRNLRKWERLLSSDEEDVSVRSIVF